MNGPAGTIDIWRGDTRVLRPGEHLTEDWAAGNAATVQPGYEYAHTSALFDITRGNNGLVNGAAACGGDYLCMAKKGYDGPTGLGTPDGTGAF